MTGNNMPPDDASFAVLAHKVDTMHQDVTELRSVLKDLTQAINKLALVEERQNQVTAAQERAFKVLEKIESKIEQIDGRVTALEIAEPEQRRVSGWAMTAVWGAAALAATMLLSKLGISL